MSGDRQRDRERLGRRRCAKVLASQVRWRREINRQLDRAHATLADLVGLFQSMAVANRRVVKTEQQDDFLRAMNAAIEKVNAGLEAPQGSGYRPVVCSTDTTPIHCGECGVASDGQRRFQMLHAGIVCHKCLGTPG